MRTVLVVAQCDRCNKPLPATDDPAQSWSIMGYEYRIDLCTTCQEDVVKFLNFLPTPENFRCPDCDRAFETQQGLSMHRTRSHSDEYGHKGFTAKVQKKPVTPGEGYLCSECGEEFVNKNALSGHMGKHRRGN